MPLFTFGLSPNEPAVKSESHLWSAPLPDSRHAFSRSFKGRDSDTQATYGDYFSAARDFLTQDDSALLCSAVGQLMERSVDADAIERVGIYLMKHGAFYHPSYIEVQACGRNWPLVLNVAVSADGRKILNQEFQNLDRLNHQLSVPYWPLVFGHGSGRTDSGRRLSMFLGQWLDGFHEFHLTAGSARDQMQVVLWDIEQGSRILNPPQVHELLRQAACILAYAYNPLTFEAILNWHHAAGDFVARQTADGLDVRLISVRNYAPLIEIDEPDVAAILEALLIYLMDISIKLRIDRLDGINQLACHPADTIPAICRGLLQGLNAAAAQRGLPEDFARTVGRFFGAHTLSELTSIAQSVLVKYSAAADEYNLMQSAIENHVWELSRTLATL